MLLVIRELLSGARRFDDIRKALGVSDKVLPNRLRTLVEDGLVERRPLAAGRVDRFGYLPTEAAAEALPILHAYAPWARKHATVENKSQLIIVCLTCGDESSQGETCSECGALLDVENVAWTRPLASDRRPQPLRGPAGT